MTITCRAKNENQKILTDLMGDGFKIFRCHKFIYKPMTDGKNGKEIFKEVCFRCGFVNFIKH